MTDDLVKRMLEHGNAFPIKNASAWIDFASLYLVQAADKIERLEEQAWKVDADVLSMREEIEQQRYEIERLRKLTDLIAGHLTGALNVVENFTSHDTSEARAILADAAYRRTK